MTEDIPGVFVITDGEGREVLTLTHDGEHLALATFPAGLGEPVLLDLAEADSLAEMLAGPWPVIRILQPGEDAAGSRPGTALARVSAPFTPAQLASLSAYQADGTVHEFTCRSDECPGDQEILRPGRLGWTCPDPGCGYRQGWAFEFMTDWSWRRPSPGGSAP